MPLAGVYRAPAAARRVRIGLHFRWAPRAKFDPSKSYADCAEPVPGPFTEYFGTLAKIHNLYIVAGLIEGAGLN